MAKLSIPLTFSDDGEHIQLSRMDAAILLTWIMGGDHDEEPETPAAPPKQETPKPEPKSAEKSPQSSERIPIQRTLPTSVAEEESARLPKQPPLQREPAPMAKKAAAAQVLNEPTPAAGEKATSKIPFDVTPQSADYPTTPPPTANELIEEDPYWEYTEGPVPEPKM